jgi:hypothetical protein
VAIIVFAALQDVFWLNLLPQSNILVILLWRSAISFGILHAAQVTHLFSLFREVGDNVPNFVTFVTSVCINT